MELIKRSDNLRGVPVLVTGAGGFIGSHLVEHLLARHAHVTAVARSRDKLALVKNAGSLAHRSCDLSRYDEVEDLISAVRPEVIFHFAAYPDGAEDFERAQDCVAANLTATLNLLEAFRRWPGKLFLYGDSCKVYGDAAVPYREDLPLQPRSSYAITKAAGWQFCQLYRAVHGVPVASVRPTMIYGPRQSYNLITYVVDCVLREQAEIRLDGGSQTRDPLFVEDAVEAILLMAGRAEQVTGRVVNLGGGCERTVVEIATAVVQLMDSHLPVVPVPRAMRPTEMRRSYCDNAEAADLLRWCPRRDFHSGLQLTIADLVQARSKRRAAVAAMGD